MTLDLSKIGWSVLDDVRQNMRLQPGDTSRDKYIASLEPREFIARYSAWHLGYRAWGIDFYELTHKLDEAVIKDA